MNLIVCLISIFLASVVHAFAMENIEADAAYDRGIKEKIREEFTQGLKLLKAQAAGLGMEVREKDFLTLQRHMYEKAILMGRCVDKAITFKKTVSDKILLDKYFKGCTETHLNFIEGLKTGKIPNSNTCSLKAMLPTLPNPPPYDFLGINDKMSDATDYVTLKDCYDNRSDVDKIVDRAR